MSRKPQKGYYVKGRFVAEGSEMDLQLKAELKGAEVSKTDLKRESAALQRLGEDLLALSAQRIAPLPLPDLLRDALDLARRITAHEGKRRQMQYVGKLMRRLSEDEISAIRAFLDEQRSGSAEEKLRLHQAEHWRDQLIASDDALTAWLAEHPGSDAQPLRALIRQARKDAPDAHAAQVAESTGQAPRKSRAYRELFALVRSQLQSDASTEEPPDA